MIRWRKKVEEYVELRRSLGFKLLAANNGLIQFASFLEQSRATHITITLAMKWAQQDKNARPTEWASGSASFAVLRVIGALMIPEPRCRHPVCCPTGLGERAHTCTATRRFGNCSRRRGDCRPLTVCGVRPITVCWGCWRWQACASVRHATYKQKM